MVTYGGMSMKPVTVPSGLFIFKNIKLEGFWMSQWLQDHTDEERQNMYDYLMKLIVRKKLRLWSERHLFGHFFEALKESQKDQKGRKVLLVMNEYEDPEESKYSPYNIDMLDRLKKIEEAGSEEAFVIKEMEKKMKKE